MDVESGETRQKVTNIPLDLFRVHSLTRTVNRDDQQNVTANPKSALEKVKIPNANFGRFYLAKRVPVMMNGAPVKDSWGKPQTSQQGFKWFDQSVFVTSGLFDLLAPKLVNLMLHSSGIPESADDKTVATVTRMYPKDLIAGLMNKSPHQLLQSWKHDPPMDTSE